MYPAKRKMKTETFFSRNPVFSFAEAVSTLAPERDRRGMVDRLKYHVKNRILKQVARGVYAVVPSGEDPGKFRPDPFLVGLALRPDAVFSHHSALELLGASHSIWSSVTLFSARRRPSLSTDGMKFSVFRNPMQMNASGESAIGTRKVERRGKLLLVTGPERTLVEGFRRPALVGGVEELVTSAAGFAALDMKLLQEVLERYGTSRLWAAAGWFLEQMQNDFHVKEDVLSLCERKKPRAPQYLERDSLGGELSKRWNLILPHSMTKAVEPNESQH
jgi:predicted transcriptional regulator of viral defense system